MSDEEVLPCVMCSQNHEKMLMLVCMDDPCINCAAMHYCSTAPPGSQIYQCAKCGEETQLDSSSVVQLQKVYNQLKGKKRFDYRRGQGSIAEPDKPGSASGKSRSKIDPEPRQKPYEPPAPTYSNPTSYTPISQPSYPSNPYNNISVRKAQEHFYMCQAHPEEELSYFCFSCGNPICPECAIHGTHREHQVQTTRKAIKSIKNTLQKYQEKLQEESASVASIANSYKNRQKEMAAQVKKEKEAVRDCFNQIRAILGEKEKQFDRAIDSCYDSNLAIVKSHTVNHERLTEGHSAARKNIESTLKKEDLAILQEYSKKQKEAKAALDSSIGCTYNPDLEGLKQLDHQLFRDEVEQLTGIISALRLSTQPRKHAS